MFSDTKFFGCQRLFCWSLVRTSTVTMTAVILVAHLSLFLCWLHDYPPYLSPWLFLRPNTLWARNSPTTALSLLIICSVYCSFVWCVCVWWWFIKCTLTSMYVSLPSFSGDCVSRSHRCCCSVSRRAEQKLLKALGPLFGKSSSKRQLRLWDVGSA